MIADAQIIFFTVIVEAIKTIVKIFSVNYIFNDCFTTIPQIALVNIWLISKSWLQHLNSSTTRMERAG